MNRETARYFKRDFEENGQMQSTTVKKKKNAQKIAPKLKNSLVCLVVFESC